MSEPRAIGTLSERRGEPSDLLIRGVRCLDPREPIDAVGDLEICDGEIAELHPAGSLAPDGVEVIEGEGLLAVPAFFDPHVHLRTPGQEHKEDLETGTRAAAAGGYCGILAMANTSPPVDTAGAISALYGRARTEATVPVGFFATLTCAMAGAELVEMAEIVDAGAVGFTDDGVPVRSARVLRRGLQYTRLSGGIIALHEEDPELSAGGHMHEGEMSAQLGIPAIPGISESTMIARDAAIALHENLPLHLQHLSARSSVQAVTSAKAQGAQLTCEAAPHHLVLTDAEVRSLDSRFKMNPPLRSEDDRQALIDGLRDGTIDCIATDHAPHAPQDKEVPFEQAAMGVTGLETAFAVLHTDLVRPGVLDLGLVVDKLSAGAAPFGLQLPSLTPGSEANVTLIDPEATWTVGEGGYESRSANCAFHGRELTGRVRMTVAGGRVAYRQPSFAIGAVA
ncbi:MAG: dihydroorotase [Solirubrobacterales bacterium]